MTDPQATGLVPATLPETTDTVDATPPDAPTASETGNAGSGDARPDPAERKRARRRASRKSRPRCNYCRKYGHSRNDCPRRNLAAENCTPEQSKETNVDNGLKAASKATPASRKMQPARVADASKAKADAPAAITITKGDIDAISAVVKEVLDAALPRMAENMLNKVRDIVDNAVDGAVERVLESKTASIDTPTLPTVVITPPPATNIAEGMTSEDSETDGGLHFES